MSPEISWEKKELMRTPSFSISPLGKESGIIFAGIPLGHEFASFLLALLQISGRAPKISDFFESQNQTNQTKAAF